MATRRETTICLLLLVSVASTTGLEVVTDTVDGAVGNIEDIVIEVAGDNILGDFGRGAFGGVRRVVTTVGDNFGGVGSFPSDLDLCVAVDLTMGKFGMLCKTIEPVAEELGLSNVLECVSGPVLANLDNLKANAKTDFSACVPLEGILSKVGLSGLTTRILPDSSFIKGVVAKASGVGSLVGGVKDGAFGKLGDLGSGVGSIVGGVKDGAFGKLGDLGSGVGSLVGGVKDGAFGKLSDLGSGVEGKAGAVLSLPTGVVRGVGGDVISIL